MGPSRAHVDVEDVAASHVSNLHAGSIPLVAWLRMALQIMSAVAATAIQRHDRAFTVTGLATGGLYADHAVGAQPLEIVRRPYAETDKEGSNHTTRILQLEGRIFVDISGSDHAPDNLTAHHVNSAVPLILASAVRSRSRSALPAQNIKYTKA